MYPSTLADPQSAKQTNAIFMKQRNAQPNAIFEGEKAERITQRITRKTRADPQSAKQTNMYY